MSGIQASRNTVSKYVSSLEAKKKVFTKRIGAYTLYLSAERRYLPRERIINFNKELFSGLKRYFPNQEKIAKKIGSEAGNYFHLHFPEEVYYNMSSTTMLELFGETFNIQEPFQDQTEIKIREMNEKGTKALYRFKKSSFIKDLEDCSYYYYAICGYIETMFLRQFKKTVKCDIVNMNISNKKDESFIDISLEIIE
jgi:hypothetical protein